VQFHRGVLLAHWCSSPCSLWQEDSSIAILPKPAEVIFAHRLSTLDFSKEIFTAGFADPNLWSNHAWATDVGLNWYLNFYTKVYLDWQHSEFGSPVLIAPNRFGPTRDMFWIRFQVFF